MKIEINLPKWKIFCKHISQCWNPIDKSQDSIHYCLDCGKVFGVRVTKGEN